MIPAGTPPGQEPGAIRSTTPIADRIEAVSTVPVTRTPLVGPTEDDLRAALQGWGQ
jgi:hypothetical protein